MQCNHNFSRESRVGPGVFIAFIFSHLLQQGVLWLWSFITRNGEKMI